MSVVLYAIQVSQAVCIMFTACFSVGVASTTVKRQNKIVVKSNFRVRDVSGVILLGEKLFLNVGHTRSRAKETKSSNIVRRCILIILLLYFVTDVPKCKGY